MTAPGYRPPRSTEDVAAGAARMIRAVGNRAAGTHEDLAALAQLRDVVEAQISRAVEAARTKETPESWAEIAAYLGVTRQAAQQRYGVSTSLDTARAS